MDIQNEKTYDAVFWAGVQGLTQYLVPLVNEAFGEHFTNSASVELLPGKQADQKPDSSFERGEMDTLALLIEKAVKMKYHFEVETHANRGIFIRIGRYDLSVARNNFAWTERGIETQLPQSAVIFLAGGESIQDKVSIFYKGAQGEARNDVPVLKIKRYSIDDLFQKRLLLLLPFYSFHFDGKFEQMEVDGIGELEEAFDEIHTRLVALTEDGGIDEAQRSQLLDCMQRVLEKQTIKYKNVSEGVRKLMGGYIFYTRTDAILDKGRAEGREEGWNAGLNAGRNEGIGIGEQNVKLLDLKKVMKKLKYSVEQAMDFLDIPSDQRPLYAGLVNAS